MCGFAGVVQREGRLPDVPALAASLGGSLAHRGPDGSGIWQGPDARVLLVHRRLAIIDPGPGGAQPMATPDDRFHIVFNGEIYNYRALRSDLESHNERLTTGSDTEVLLRLIARGGAPRLADVRGMFAFACWDSRERSLLVARDRFGIKPLYVAAGSGRIAFASELGALRTANLAGGGTSAAGILAFLQWGSVPPPLTWQRGVEMLEPGSWRRWWLDGREERGVFADARAVYANGPGAGDAARPKDVRAFRAEVAAAVRESIRAHLVADVPVGVFLSGGIDSGALVSCATSVGAANLQTFTVGFDDESSEVERARWVAERFGTTHHELHVDPAEIVRDLPAVLASLDQPTIDAVNSYYVSRAVAATGIKAVLSGAGGDELFGGYPSFRRLPRALAAKHLAGPLWPMVGSVAGAFMPERLGARWRHFAATNGSLVEAYRVQRGFFLPGEIASLAGPALLDAAVWRGANEQVQDAERKLLSSAGPEQMPAAVARLESRLYLGSQLLRDLDVMSMAHGLEVRVPFVDHELVERVWPQLAFHSDLMTGKRLLAGTLDRPLPEAIVRHPKQGFTLPFARWMEGELAPFVRDGMRRLADAGWVAPGVPDAAWASWRRGVSHWSRPWGLAVLGHFLSKGDAA
jgi:asparagine synthase (glutamine-hydrolysing)